MIINNELEKILYSHIHNWCPIAKLLEKLEEFGVEEIMKGDRNNMTDGEYHAFYLKNKDSTFELHANIWSAKTFQSLIDWVVKNDN